MGSLLESRTGDASTSDARKDTLRPTRKGCFDSNTYTRSCESLELRKRANRYLCEGQADATPGGTVPEQLGPEVARLFTAYAQLLASQGELAVAAKYCRVRQRI